MRIEQPVGSRVRVAPSLRIFRRDMYTLPLRSSFDWQ